MTLTQALTQERPETSAQLLAQRYASVLVHVEPVPGARQRLQVAVELARDLQARLIGLGAETIEPFPAPDPLMGYATGEWLVLLQEQVNNDLQAAEKAFRKEAEGLDGEWRSAQDFPIRALVRNARAADLVVASPQARGGGCRSVDPAELVMTAGRPVLLAPPGARRLRGEAVVVAWKDTREARRAVADALPLLSRANDVIVQAVCAAQEDENAAFQAADVCAALRRHGVKARPAAARGGPDEVVAILTKTAEQAGADLIVAGAYGHSRAREWVFGGVTFELMRHVPCFLLLSH
ncbi:MAG TPA: universal stress protein [Phenylobacterium sp.]|uniref:universal stress protein n=1 Tax=Phenylobacterium sp. TaxID=1871053 RepID=UPI002B4A71E0|nr:universal stress protein [Phenylobacterium sp.]HKR89965.1 universal stress protein [Phenylobacterium sp.]